VPDDDVVHDNLCRCTGASLKRGRRWQTQVLVAALCLSTIDEPTATMGATYSARRCACAAERTGGWTPWRGRAEHLAGVLKCAHRWPGRLRVSQIRSKWSNRTHLYRSNIFGIWLPKRLLSTAGSGRIIYGIIYVCVRGARWVKSDAIILVWLGRAPNYHTGSRPLQRKQ
jgi:hypothetical protein